MGRACSTVARAMWHSFIYPFMLRHAWSAIVFQAQRWGTVKFREGLLQMGGGRDW